MDSLRFKSFLPVIALLVAILVGCTPQQTVKKETLVWPRVPEKARIQFVRAIQGKNDFVKSKLDVLKKTLTGENSLEKLIKPYGVATDSKGRLYVSDAGNHCVLIFDENAIDKDASLTYLGTSGFGQLTEPAGIAIDDNDTIYVSDVQLNTVFVYGPDRKFVRTFGEKNVFTRPAGIAFNKATREIVVVDTKSYQIKCFSMDGKLTRTFGSKGNGKGQFNLPSNVTCDSTGNIYIVDTMNFRVQIFDKNGSFLSTFGQPDNVPGSFSRPKGIALDGDGNVYVVDSGFDNIQIFQKDGTLLLYFGEAGTDDGQFQLPAGICIDKHNRLYVADQYNGRVQVFQYIKY